MFFEKKTPLLLTVTNFEDIPPIPYVKKGIYIFGKKRKKFLSPRIYIYLFLVTLSNNIYI